MNLSKLKKPEWLLVIICLVALAAMVPLHRSLLLLAFAQNVSFSIVSRSRNRDNLTYHIVAAVLSNGVWFLTFRYLITSNMTLSLFVPYCIGTVTGSVWGVKVSMLVERLLGAKSDSHIKNG